ncbi:Adenosine deaminase-like protein [Schistosoma japonicum]|uniref:Adenosine deaminase-like protein n=1 Tax=Schistosoma japonicum TaxID=6182 RepID=A0A4Z2DVT1_SCHJA|nr:Adenosine deaminase-like protein [Schistosoma japonicum]
MNSFYYDLPKVELHAHLSGSISTEFLKRESIAHNGLQYTDPRFGFESWEGDLDRCFNYFQKIHKYIDTPEILQRATASVIEEFCQENVILLELRTTLRPLPTHRSYLNSVIKGIQGSPSVLDNRIYVTLLLSLDRSKSVDEALITLELAKEYYSSGLISGIDLSGNPLAGNLCDFVPLLNTARSYGFKTTVHIAEVTNQSEDWCKFLNLYLPDRLGHGTFLTDLDENAVLARGIVLNSKIPLELCLTSNVKSKTVENYESHHINYWMEKKHPICICTDDKGLFNCTLSGELQLSAERCGLSKQQHFQILVDSVNMSFFSEDVKYHSLQKIKEYFNKFIIDHLDKI